MNSDFTQLYLQHHYLLLIYDLSELNLKKRKKPKCFLHFDYTAILYRVSTGPEQGFPCVVFPYREKPVFITGFPGDKNRFFPVRKTTQGKPCFHYRDGFAARRL